MLISHNATLLAESEGVVVSGRKTPAVSTGVPDAAHMTEAPRGLFYLPIICFWTGRRGFSRFAFQIVILLLFKPVKLKPAQVIFKASH